jgi:hypothetical protein
MNFMSNKFALALALVSAVGCGGKLAGDSTGSPGNGSPGGSSSPAPLPPLPGIGDVDLNVTLQGGQTIHSLSFTLSNGTASDTVTGTIPLGSVPSSIIVVPIYRTPANAATGYAVTLSGTNTTPEVTCTGTAGLFAVTAGDETVVNVLVTCAAADGSSAIEVNPTIHNCPNIGTLTAVLPNGQTQLNTTAPGNTFTIYATADAPNLASLTYTFSVTTGTGTLGTPVVAAEKISATVVFTCPTTPETDVITLVTADSSGAVCPSSLTTSSVAVTCAGPACAGIGSGVEATPNTAAGACPAGQTNTGTLTDSSGNFCCSDS